MTGSSPLEGTVSLVTGAGGGIGNALCRALASAGSELWLVGRTSQSLDGTAHACGPAPARSVAIDLGDPGSVAVLVEQVARESARLDVLVHSAGAIATGPLAGAPVESLDRQYAVNVRAVYELTQALLPLLRRTRGQVVVINSSVVTGPRPGAGQYAATKHALLGLTDALRQEVNPDGIRVLSVFPGQTASALQRDLHEQSGRPYRPETLLQPDDVAAMILASLTLPRTAEVTDLHIRPMARPG